MFNYRDKIIIVTGATGGLGRQLCFEFVKRKAKLAICSQSEEKLKILSEGILKSGGQSIYKVVDVSVPEQVKEFVRYVLQEYGGIDVLVNNAGIATCVCFTAMEETLLKREMGVNYFGPVYFMKEIVPCLLKRGRGQIINISSVSAFRPLPFLSSYSASKAALSAFTDALRTEFYNEKIDIINVYPGKVNTKFCQQEEIIGRGKNKNILGKGMDPKRAARKILIAASKGKTVIHTHMEGRIIFLLNALFARIFEKLLYRVKVKN